MWRISDGITGGIRKDSGRNKCRSDSWRLEASSLPPPEVEFSNLMHSDRLEMSPHSKVTWGKSRVGPYKFSFRASSRMLAMLLLSI